MGLTTGTGEKSEKIAVRVRGGVTRVTGTGVSAAVVVVVERTVGFCPTAWKARVRALSAKSAVDMISSFPNELR